MFTRPFLLQIMEEETNTLWNYFYMETIIDMMLWVVIIGVTVGVITKIYHTKK